jgi:hypothetical protein
MNVPLIKLPFLAQVSAAAIDAVRHIAITDCKFIDLHSI